MAGTAHQDGQVDWRAMEQVYAQQARFWRTAEQSWMVKETAAPPLGGSQGAAPACEESVGVEGG